MRKTIENVEQNPVTAAFHPEADRRAPKSGDLPVLVAKGEADVQAFGDSERPVLVLHDDAGREIRWPVSRNAYYVGGVNVPVDTLFIHVTAHTQIAKIAPSAQAPGASTAEAKLIAAGDVDMLAMYYAATAGSAKVTKRFRDLARAACA